MSELAWAAGFFDGEGCIMVRPLRTHGCVTWVVDMRLANTNRENLDVFMAAVGQGKLYLHKRQQAHHKQRWDWIARSRQAEIVLRALLPYLVGKKREAVLALEARSLIRPVGGGGKHPNQNGHRFQEISDEMTLEKHGANKFPPILPEDQP